MVLPFEEPVDENSVEVKESVVEKDPGENNSVQELVVEEKPVMEDG